MLHYNVSPAKMTETERHQLLIQWNDTMVEFPSDKCIHELFEEQVAQRPNAVAVIFEEEHVTYAEVNGRANQLAHHLRSLGVKPDTLVAICLERSLEMLVGILGILKSGGAYVPLDPNYPVERLAYMLEDIAASVLVTQVRLKHKLPQHQAKVVLLDEDLPVIAQRPDSNLLNCTRSRNLAYCMFTSGSTGKPKAIATEHRSVVRLVKRANYARLVEEEVFLQLAPLSFDASTLEIWGSLLNGARLAVLSPTKQSLDDIAWAIEHHCVSTLWLTAALFERICKTHLQALRGVGQLLAGGDVLSLGAVGDVLSNLPECQLINGYGPTETTTFAACYRFPKNFAGSNAPVGRPISNTQIYILDERLNPVQVGVPGEIHIAGPGLARGYLNRRDLTAEKFIPNPFGEPGGRMYKSGDLGRYRPDGNIEFLGRMDHQVKIRGFRIELGEVECRLLRCEGVREVVVLAHGDTPGDKRLVAYLVPKEQATITADYLRAQLQKFLPDYMLPAAFVFLEGLPINVNGKIDRKALPVPEEISRNDSSIEYVAPSTPTEELLASIWAEVLKLDRVGVSDGFLSLGGSSIQAIEISYRTARSLSVSSIPPPRKNVTIAECARDIDSAMSSEQPLPSSCKTDFQESNKKSISYAQQQLWFLEQMGDAWRAYRFHARLDLFGKLNVGRLQQAINSLIQRHEILRTGFISRDHQLERSVLVDRKVALPFIDLSNFDPSDKKPVLTEHINDELNFRFDVAKPPLMRWLLFRLSNEEHVLIQTEHHYVHDGKSSRVLIQELAALYNALARSVEGALLPPVEATYSEFCEEEQRWLESSDFRRQASQWAAELSDFTENLELFSERRRGAPVRRFRGAQVRQSIDAKQFANLGCIAATLGVSRFVVALTVFGLLCARHSGAERFLIGVALANRISHRFRSVAGMFVNMVPIPFALTNTLSVSELVQASAQRMDFALSHSAVPLAEIVKHLGLTQRLKGEAPFSVAFSFHDSMLLSPQFDGLTVCVEEGLSNGSSKFDINVTAILGNETSPHPMEFVFEYNTDLFDSATIERMVGHYCMLLEAVVANPQARISDLPLLTEAERHKLLVEWNGTKVEFPSDKCIHQLFEEQVEKKPEAVAVVFEDQQLTYGELNSRANQLAHHLRSLGVKPDTLVAICVERSLEMVVSLLGILKAGGAYVPLDPEYPQERLAYMLQDTIAPVLLTQARLKNKLPEHQAKEVYLDKDWAVIAQGPDSNLTNQTDPLNLAYCVYTSGSTGWPKGALNTHRGFVNLVRWFFSESLQTSTTERVILASSLSFDLTQKNVLGTLIEGSILIIPAGTLMDGESFVRALGTHRPTRLNCAPSAYRALREYASESPVKTVILGGEPIDTKLATQLLAEQVRLVNSYGPTECSDVAISYLNSAGASRVDIPLGKAIPNVKIYILDKEANLVPIGVPGEICISGVGVGRGYLHRPDLTAEKFIPNPYGERGARMYKTGDLGRYLPDGNIEFLGRGDHQVKIRGFRIELGEIENSLLRCEGVRESVVLVREDVPGDKRLVAYVVAEEVATPSIASMRAHLRKSLPEYMIPDAFVYIEAIPLNANGKIDRRVLLRSSGTNNAERMPFVVGQNSHSPTTKKILDLMHSVVKSQTFSEDCNFFDSGFHSINLMRLVVRCRSHFDVNLTVVETVKAVTPLGLAAVIEERLGLSAET
jgi:amino acid adenylation domain-containing protein